MSDPTSWGWWAWENKEKLWAALKELYAWLFRKGTTEQGQLDDRGVLFLGSGGVGKSTLGKILSGNFDLLFDLPRAYDESLVLEYYPLGGPEGISVVVPPGQPHRRDDWPALLADLSAGRYRGVVLLNAYGYHNHGIGTGVSYKDHPLYLRQTPPKTKPKFVEAFLAERRADELEVLRQIVAHISVIQGKVWFLSLVTKQDLWFEDRVAVEAFYRDAEYGKLITDIQTKLSLQRFRHELVLASLVISNFKTGKDEILRFNTAGYDHHEHSQSLIKLFQTLDQLRSWEVENG